MTKNLEKAISRTSSRKADQRYVKLVMDAVETAKEEARLSNRRWWSSTEDGLDSEHSPFRDFFAEANIKNTGYSIASQAFDDYLYLEAIPEGKERWDSLTEIKTAFTKDSISKFKAMKSYQNYEPFRRIYWRAVELGYKKGINDFTKMMRQSQKMIEGCWNYTIRYHG